MKYIKNAIKKLLKFLIIDVNRLGIGLLLIILAYILRHPLTYYTLGPILSLTAALIWITVTTIYLACITYIFLNKKTLN